MELAVSSLNPERRKVSKNGLLFLQITTYLMLEIQSALLANAQADPIQHNCPHHLKIRPLKCCECYIKMSIASEFRRIPSNQNQNHPVTIIKNSGRYWNGPSQSDLTRDSIPLQCEALNKQASLDLPMEQL
jgi:hypothetical protein